MYQARIPNIQENRLVLINSNNIDIYINLAHSYEAEFSDVTHTLPNEKGIFEPHTLPTAPYTGYLLYNLGIPIGFCLIKITDAVNDIAEFYIVPSMRNNKFGLSLASTIFEMYPGKWEVRQIEGADAAKSFWRKVIKTYSQNQFQEEIITDPDWGSVTRQQFISSVRENADAKISTPHPKNLE